MYPIRVFSIMFAIGSLSLFSYVCLSLKLLALATRLHGFHISFYNLMLLTIHAPLLECIFDLDAVSNKLFLKELQPFMNL
jgi:hypothetical protein